LPRFSLGWAALGVLALAACTDTQSPDESPSTPTTPSDASLPVLETMQLTTPLANAVAGFQIDLRFVNTPTAAQEQFFRAAAARWESIITGDVPDAEGVIPARSCGNNFRTPSLQGPFDDLVIHVLLQPIDGPGAVLGAAGACLVRSEDLLPLYGLMFFDTDDLATIEQAGVLDEVIIHEMGHVLGFSAGIWNLGDRELLQGTADPRFVGPNAIAAFHEVGGRGATIPLEDEFGPGTRLSHWDEDTFDNELMTGFISLSGTSPLSVMTIGSMQDLGYQVSYAPADRYQVRGSQERADEETTASAQINLIAGERLIRPLAVVK
jgi:hypothetical protein